MTPPRTVTVGRVELAHAREQNLYYSARHMLRVERVGLHWCASLRNADGNTNRIHSGYWDEPQSAADQLTAKLRELRAAIDDVLGEGK